MIVGEGEVEPVFATNNEKRLGSNNLYGWVWLWEAGPGWSQSRISACTEPPQLLRQLALPVSRFPLSTPLMGDFSCSSQPSLFTHQANVSVDRIGVHSCFMCVLPAEHTTGHMHRWARLTSLHTHLHWAYMHTTCNYQWLLPSSHSLTVPRPLAAS